MSAYFDVDTQITFPARRVEEPFGFKDDVFNSAESLFPGVRFNTRNYATFDDAGIVGGESRHSFDYSFDIDASKFDENDAYAMAEDVMYYILARIMRLHGLSGRCGGRSSVVRVEHLDTVEVSDEGEGLGSILDDPGSFEAFFSRR